MNELLKLIVKHSFISTALVILLMIYISFGFQVLTVATALGFVFIVGDHYLS